MIDCDVLSHRVATDPSVIATIGRTFGREVITEEGNVNREALGRIIFADSRKRNQLNGIMNRRIFWEIVKEFCYLRFKRKEPLIVLDAPLLFETKMFEYVCFPIMVVHVDDHELLLRRLMNRDKIDREEAERKVRAQMPIAEKKRRGDLLINNGGSFEDLKERMKTEVFPELLNVMNFHDKKE